MRTSLLLFLALAACADGGGPGKDGDPADTTDADGDGIPASTDCDDGDASVGEGTPAYPDADADGYGDAAGETVACDLDGLITEGGDCDDANAAFHPGATEVCDAADADEDCNGVADDADAGTDDGGKIAAYADADQDGFGDPATPVATCDLGAGAVLDQTDCDDAVATVNPDATETCDSVDDDCDGEIDEADAADAGTWYADADGDGFGDPAVSEVSCQAPDPWVANATDCDDARAVVYPGADEICDGLDDDCDGDVDEDAVDALDWWADADGDGYGDATDHVMSCDRVSGYVRDDTDCDDGDDGVSPGTNEVCDAADTDEDCDGLVDDDDTSVVASGKVTWYADDDGDGYGDVGDWSLACDLPSGSVADETDCDDADAAINPGEAEVCDAADTDEDCDGLVDDDDGSVTGTTTAYLDADGDGYGDASASISRCILPSGYSSRSTDCDDADAAINPLATEVCDDADTDEDCDGLSDDDDSSASSSGMSTWYVDADGDGFGTSSAYTSACDAPSGYGEGTDDCDDADSAINPDAAEVCGDAVDDNCDGVTSCDTDIDDDDRTFTGTGSGTYFGYSLSSADQDGDGVEDLIFGTNWSGGGTGSSVAYVFTGGGTGDVTASSANATFQSNCSGGPGPCGGGGGGTGYGGASVAGLGDTNGDGYDDFAIGGNQSYSGSNGTIYLLRGPQSGTVNLTSATATWNSGSSEQADTVLAAGDVNGDGTDDALVSGDSYSGNTGMAYLITSYSTGTHNLSSIATATFYGESGGDYLTASGGRGDLDGDGYDDIVLGAHGDDDIGTDSGAAYVVLGPQTGTMTVSSADLKLKGENAGDAAGQYTTMGDLDGDGYSDLVVVAPYASTYGAVYVLNGPFSSGWALASADAYIETARAVGPLSATADGDVDPDGCDDLLLGYPADTTSGGYGGAGALFHGPVSGTLGEDDADWLITGTSGGGWVGQALAFVGSQDGTSGDDVLLGASYTTPSGAVYLFYGDEI